MSRARCQTILWAAAVDMMPASLRQRLTAGLIETLKLAWSGALARDHDLPLTIGALEDDDFGRRCVWRSPMFAVYWVRFLGSCPMGSQCLHGLSYGFLGSLPFRRMVPVTVMVPAQWSSIGHPCPCLPGPMVRGLGLRLSQMVAPCLLNRFRGRETGEQHNSRAKQALN